MSINKAEQAVAYAALILADESILITPKKLETLLKAAGVEDVEPIWTTVFAKALEGKDVKNILTEVVASRPAVGGTTQNRNEKDDAVPDCDKGKERDDAEGGQNDDDDDDSVIGLSLFD